VGGVVLSSVKKGFADYLAYSYIVPPGGVIALKNGSYMMGYLYEGKDFESTTKEEVEHISAMTNNAMRRLGNGWMTHFEMVRMPDSGYPIHHFTEPTNLIIDAERAFQHQTEGTHFETMNFIFFTYLPPAIEKNGLYRKVIDFVSDGIGEQSLNNENQIVDYMEMAIQNVMDVWGQNAKISRLNFIPFQGVIGNPESGVVPSGFDEMLQVLNYFVSGRWHPVRVTPYNTGDIDVLLAKDAYFGSPLTVNNRYVCLVSVHGYPLETYPAMLQQLCMMPQELRWSNRFIFSDYRKAQSMLDSMRRKWVQKIRGLFSQLIGNERAAVNQDAVHMVSDIDDAAEELTAGWVAYGKHTSTVVTRGETREEAENIGHEVIKIFERHGFTARIESINATEAFLGSLPGHGYENVRKPYINSINLMDIVPLSHEWTGDPYNPSPEISKYYQKKRISAPPPSLLQATSVGSNPFKLNIHVSDLGHTLILGPSGSGKSTLLSLIVSQFERYKDAQIFCFDKGYSMFPLAVSLCDSVHYDLGSEANSLSLCPLAEIDTVTDQGVAAEWLELMFILQGGEITPLLRSSISDAIKILASSTAYSEDRARRRTMTAFLSTVQNRELQEVFRYYVIGNTGQMLDGERNDIQYAKTTVFELEHLFNMDQKIVIPVFIHIFKQIEKRILSAYESAQSGRPSLIVIDEAWLALSNEIFASKIKEWLKVLRKNNCAVILATQSLNDIVNSPIMDAVLDSCETRILLPNPNALSDSMESLYMKHLALNKRQVSIIAHAEKKKEYFYACESRNYHRLFSLALGPVALSFLGATGKEDLSEVRRLRSEYGDIWPEQWLKNRHCEKWGQEWRKLYDKRLQSKVGKNDESD
jgi:type IV secretion system protein VirB4